MRPILLLLALPALAFAGDPAARVFGDSCANGRCQAPVARRVTTVTEYAPAPVVRYYAAPPLVAYREVPVVRYYAPPTVYYTAPAVTYYAVPARAPFPYDGPVRRATRAFFGGY